MYEVKDDTYAELLLFFVVFTFYYLFYLFWVGLFLVHEVFLFFKGILVGFILVRFYCVYCFGIVGKS